MNKKALFAGAIFLMVATTITILHHRTAIGALPGGPQLAQTHTDAAAAEPKQEAPPVEVKLIGIMTVLDRKQALLRVEPPAGTSGRGESYILSEGQSQGGLTVESIDTTNATVTLRVGQIRKTLRPEKAPRS
jgi:hypothetical protein